MVILSDFEPFNFMLNCFYFLFLVYFLFFSFSNFMLERNTNFNINIKDIMMSEKMFFFILVINFCGLSGSWDSFSGWPSVAISMSILSWMCIMIRWMIKNFKYMFSHLTPSNLFFMTAILLTFIEILSNLIRPLTLGMRLCANILGGHLILDLMSEMKTNFFISLLFFMYEMFVCFMQSLIFSLLILSYFEEGS